MKHVLIALITTGSCLIASAQKPDPVLARISYNLIHIREEKKTWLW